MKKIRNQQKAREFFELAGQNILKGLEMLGLELDKPNFEETPHRVGKAYLEIFQGIFDGEKNTKEQVDYILSKSFPVKDENPSEILQTNIKAYSVCPHHLLPVLMNVAILYKPEFGGQVLGLSKLSRLTKVLASKPVLQEDLTTSIVNELESLGIEGCAVKVSGLHCCCLVRGTKSEAITTTYKISGCYKRDELNTIKKLNFNSEVL